MVFCSEGIEFDGVRGGKTSSGLEPLDETENRLTRVDSGGRREAVLVGEVKPDGADIDAFLTDFLDALGFRSGMYGLPNSMPTVGVGGATASVYILLGKRDSPCSAADPIVG